MAQKEPETGPSLELPSLFGRRKRRADQSGDTATMSRADETSTSERSASEPWTSGHGAEVRADDATTVITRVEPEPEPMPATAHTPAVTPTAVPTPAATAPPAAAEPVSAPPPASTPAPAAAVPSGAPTPSTPSTRSTAKPAGGRRRAETSGRSLPELAVSTAALLVGAAVGLAGCVLTYLGLQGCELVTGTGSCGGPGLLILVVILVVMVVLGAAVLRMLRVPDPGNVSFLGVGMLTVVALVFLADYLYDPLMFVVVPAVTAVTFAIARWVTTLYAEDVLGDDDRMPRHDIR